MDRRFRDFRISHQCCQIFFGKNPPKILDTEGKSPDLGENFKIWQHCTIYEKNSAEYADLKAVLRSLLGLIANIRK